MKRLLEHNQTTMADVERFISQGENCCVVNACGSGKTSVMAAIIEKHPDKTYLILSKQVNAKEYFRTGDNLFCRNNVLIRTYSKMHADVKKGKMDDYNADIYLLDEAHYLGAPAWGESFRKISEKWNPLLIGLTATPQRYEDQGTDKTIVSRFFDGNSAGNFTASDLEQKGVFVKPEYVLSIYDMARIIDQQEMRITESNLPAKNKEMWSKKLNKLYADWKENSSPLVVLKKYLPNYMYKNNCNRILVYVSNLKEIKKKKATVDRMIKDVFKGKTVKSYVYTCKTSEKELQKFLKEDCTYIKVLYSIDKIMETIHIEDLRVMIMLRPSVSARIITQQAGRVNSIGNKNRPLIIDMVGNLEKLQEIRTPSIETSRAPAKETAATGIRLPYVSRALNVFEEIDKAINSSTSYTYKKATGTLKEMCYVFHRDEEEMRALLAENDFKTALKKAKVKKIKESTLKVGTASQIPHFTMNAEQKEYASKKMHILSNYIANRNVRDEDLCQDLYIAYCHAIVKNWNYRIGYDMASRVITCLRRYHLNAMRYEYLQEQLSAELTETSLVEDVDIAKYELKSMVMKALTTLSERERSILTDRFGLEDLRPKTADEVGEKWNITRERIRQIEAKALYKMKCPPRKDLLVDFWE